MEPVNQNQELQMITHVYVLLAILGRIVTTLTSAKISIQKTFVVMEFVWTYLEVINATANLATPGKIATSTLMNVYQFRAKMAQLASTESTTLNAVVHQAMTESSVILTSMSAHPIPAQKDQLVSI